MKLRLVHPISGALAEFDGGDIQSSQIFVEYVLDGWLPAGVAEERFSEQIRAAYAAREAAMKEASHG